MYRFGDLRDLLQFRNVCYSIWYTINDIVVSARAPDAQNQEFQRNQRILENRPTLTHNFVRKAMRRELVAAFTDSPYLVYNRPNQSWGLGWGLEAFEGTRALLILK